jgi:hypothetical protein
MYALHNLIKIKLGRKVLNKFTTNTLENGDRDITQDYLDFIKENIIVSCGVRDKIKDKHLRSSIAPWLVRSACGSGS